MVFDFECPFCSAVLDPTDDLGGVTADCPGCGKQVTVTRKLKLRVPPSGSPSTVPSEPCEDDSIALVERGNISVRFRLESGGPEGEALLSQKLRREKPLGDPVRFLLRDVDKIQVEYGESAGEFSRRMLKAPVLFVLTGGLPTLLICYFFDVDWFNPRIGPSVTFLSRPGVDLGIGLPGLVYVSLSSKEEARRLEQFLRSKAKTRLRYRYR